MTSSGLRLSVSSNGCFRNPTAKRGRGCEDGVAEKCSDGARVKGQEAGLSAYFGMGRVMGIGNGTEEEEGARKGREARRVRVGGSREGMGLRRAY